MRSAEKCRLEQGSGGSNPPFAIVLVGLTAADDISGRISARRDLAASCSAVLGDSETMATNQISEVAQVQRLFLETFQAPYIHASRSHIAERPGQVAKVERRGTWLSIPQAHYTLGSESPNRECTKRASRAIVKPMKHCSKAAVRRPYRLLTIGIAPQLNRRHTIVSTCFYFVLRLMGVRA